MTVENRKVEEGENRVKIETFEDILPHVGEAGCYQFILFIILLPFTFVYAFLYFTQFFITLVPNDHWCTVPELMGKNLTDAEMIELSIPLANAEELLEEGSTMYSRCQMYAVNFTEQLMLNVTRGNSSWPKTSCKYGWTFNYSTIPYTSIAAELEWVCDKTYLSSLSQSFFFIGSILGGFVFGYIADHYGRIPALVSCNCVGFFASLATAFCNDFWTFAIARLIAGSSFDNCFNVLFIIVIEYVGPKYRTLVANMSFGIYFTIASSILPWIAYWIADWRTLSWVTALPLLIAFFGPWIVPESARWYILAGKPEKAVEMLKRFEKFNGKTVKPEVYEEFKRSCREMAEKDKKLNSYTVLDLFKKPRLAKNTIVLVIYWLLIILVFDGHVWNLKLLHPDVFTSFSIAAFTELPAAILLVFYLDKWGRRWMGFFSMLMCAIFSWIALATPDGPITVAMVIMARLGVNISGNIGFQYAAEVLPTVVRAQGVSLIHIIGYFAHIIGPYVIYLAEVKKELPLIFLGLAALVDAFLTLTLPETLDQELPETLQEGNDFGREQSFWWIPCLSSSHEKRKKYRKNKIGAVNVGFNPGSLSKIDSTRL